MLIRAQRRDITVALMIRPAPLVLFAQVTGRVERGEGSGEGAAWGWQGRIARTGLCLSQHRVQTIFKQFCI